MHRILFALAVSGLAGCSSILDNRTQDISVATEPASAHCRLLRSGSVIADIAETPGQVTIRKSPHDIVIVCDKEGYQQTSYIDEADVSSETVGSSIIGGGLGWAIDSTTGTANQYEGKVLIKLVPVLKNDPRPQHELEDRVGNG